jgi:urease accessory protein UreH
MLAPGRFARGEAFRYTQLELQTRILGPNRVELLADTLLLEPGRRSPTSRGLAGSHTFIGTALALAPGENVDKLAVTLDQICQQTGSTAAACLLPGDIGVAVRALTHSHRSLRAVLDEVWRAAREILVGATPPRRRK